MTIRELKEEIVSLNVRQNELVNGAEKENRGLSEVEEKEYSDNETKIDELRGRINKLETMEARKSPVDFKVNDNVQKEVKDFRFSDYVRKISSGKPLDGYYKEINEEAEKDMRNATGKGLSGYGIPLSVFYRDSTAGVAGQGGNTIATELPGNFIPALRNKIVLAQAGATFLSGLQGDIAIPKQSSLPTFAWAAENGAGTETNITWAQVTLSPKRLNGYIDLSKQLVNQASFDIERMIQDEIVSGIARAYDDAGLNGTGASNQPTGIRNQGSVGTVAHGTNGAAPSWPKLVEFETTAMAANAPVGKAGYVTNSKVVGALKTTAKDSGSGLFLYNDLMSSSPANGYPLLATNAMYSNLTKGTGTNLSSMVFSSDWGQLLMGQWGAVDLVVDPYTLATTSLIRMVIQMFGDVAVKNPEAFVVSNDIVA